MIYYSKPTSWRCYSCLRKKIVVTNIEELSNHWYSHSHDNLPIKSDHHLVTFDLHIESPEVSIANSSTFILDFNRANFEKMNNYLIELDLTLSDDVEYSWSIIKPAILDATALFIPKIKLKPSNLPKYFTPNIKHWIVSIYTLRKKKLRSP